MAYAPTAWHFNDNTGVCDWHRRGALPSGDIVDYTQYTCYETYRGFLISYHHLFGQSEVKDAGAKWPEYLQGARDLIDRRFPEEVKPVAQGFQLGDAAAIDSTFTADESVQFAGKFLSAGDSRRQHRKVLVASLETSGCMSSLGSWRDSWSTARHWYDSRQANGQASYDIRQLFGNDQQGVMDLTATNQINGLADFSSFARYEVYRGFVIYFADSKDGEGRIDDRLGDA